MSETMHSLLSVIAALREERASLRSLLKSIEWRGDDCDSACPVCEGIKPTAENPPREESYDPRRRPQMLHRVGHASDCTLAAAIREAP